MTGNNASGGTLPSGLLFWCSPPDCPARAGQSAGSGGWGGGIDNKGTLTIPNSTMSTTMPAGRRWQTELAAPAAMHPRSAVETAGNGGSGGAIFNESSARLTITARRSPATPPGAAATSARAAMPRRAAPGGSCRLPERGGFGGAIFDSGILTITDSTLSGNQSGRGGNGATGGTGMSAANGSPSFSSSGGVGGVDLHRHEPDRTRPTTRSRSTPVTRRHGRRGSAIGRTAASCTRRESRLVQMSFATVANNTAAANRGRNRQRELGALTEAGSIVAANTARPRRTAHREHHGPGKQHRLRRQLLSGAQRRPTAQRTCLQRGSDTDDGARSRSAAIDGFPATRARSPPTSVACRVRRARPATRAPMSSPRPPSARRRPPARRPPPAPLPRRSIPTSPLTTRR